MGPECVPSSTTSDSIVPSTCIIFKTHTHVTVFIIIICSIYHIIIMTFDPDIDNDVHTDENVVILTIIT